MALEQKTQATTGGPGLVRNAAWGGLGFLLPLIVQIISIPLFLAGLGPADFGRFTLLQALLALLGLGSAAAGEATTKSVAAHHAAGIHRRSNAVVLALLLLFIALGVAVAAALIVAAPWLSLQLLALPRADADRGQAALHALALTLPAALAFPIVAGTFNGFQRYRASQLMRLGVTLLSTLGGLLILGLGQGLVALVQLLAATYWAVTSAGLLVLLLRRLIAWEWPTDSKSPITAALGYAGYSALAKLGMLGFGTLDRLLIGPLLGLRALSVYVVCQALTSKLQAVPAAAAQVLLPAFSASKLTAPTTDPDLLTRSWRMSVVGSAVLMTLALAASPWLLQAWISPAFGARGQTLLLWMIGVYGVAGLLVVPLYHQLGTGRVRAVAGAQLVASLVYCGLIGPLSWGGLNLEVSAGLAALPVSLGWLAWRAQGQSKWRPETLVAGAGPLFATAALALVAGLTTGFIVKKTGGRDTLALASATIATLGIWGGAGIQWRRSPQPPSSRAQEALH